MKNKRKALPGPYASPTKDTRFAGTFEVLVPAPNRARPHRAPLQFETQESAEAWIHSPEGKDTIRDILAGENAAASAGVKPQKVP